ncbi:MAG: hypothetical protein WD426_01985 [Anditalea sp.]
MGFDRITQFSFLLLGLYVLPLHVNAQEQNFQWPEGKKMALSLSFDDARTSNPTLGAGLLNKREGMADTVNIPATVKASPDGSLKLSAEKGKATGPEIKYMPEWKAFGWFTAKDQVEWEVEIPKAGKYDVFLDWSVSDGEAGKSYLFETGAIKLSGNVEKSGSWETFRSKKIGQVDLPGGIQKMVFKPGSNFGYKKDR